MVNQPTPSPEFDLSFCKINCGEIFRHLAGYVCVLNAHGATSTYIYLVAATGGDRVRRGRGGGGSLFPRRTRLQIGAFGFHHHGVALAFHYH